jgi:hypothetical protein
MGRKVIRFGNLIALAALGATGPLVLVACGGGSAPLGSQTQSQREAVAISDVSGTVTACPVGYAHPNVCCDVGPSQTASCGIYPDAPFTPCTTGSTLYPDPRSCCPLDPTTGGCITPPPAPPPVGTCVYPCPPGQYEPAGQSGTCCGTDANGNSYCSGSGSNITCAVSSTCSCAACPADEGASCPPCDCPPPPPACPQPDPTCGVGCACPACPAGETCAPCDCPPPPPNCGQPPTCGTCPPGWQTPEGEAYLCCQSEPSGVIACFSQAYPPPPSPTPAQTGTATSN